MVLIIKDQSLRVMYEDLDVGRVVANFIMDLSPFNYSGGQVGLFTAAHQAEFSNFIIGELSGPNAVTTFCDGGICDERLGLCTTSPTQNPTARTGDVAAAGICPGPVGGNTIEIDTADITQFTIVDQDPITEPCAWSASAAGLRQSSNAWGNAPGDNTLMGCIAIIGTETYTDFIIEVSAIHDDDDAWGFVRFLFSCHEQFFPLHRSSATTCRRISLPWPTTTSGPIPRPTESWVPSRS